MYSTCERMKLDISGWIEKVNIALDCHGLDVSGCHANGLLSTSPWLWSTEFKLQLYTCVAAFERDTLTPTWRPRERLSPSVYLSSGTVEVDRAGGWVWYRHTRLGVVEVDPCRGGYRRKALRHSVREASDSIHVRYPLLHLLFNVSPLNRPHRQPSP